MLNDVEDKDLLNALEEKINETNELFSLVKNKMERSQLNVDLGTTPASDVGDIVRVAAENFYNKQEARRMLEQEYGGQIVLIAEWESPGRKNSETVLDNDAPEYEEYKKFIKFLEDICYSGFVGNNILLFRKDSDAVSNWRKSFTLTAYAFTEKYRYAFTCHAVSNSAPANETDKGYLGCTVSNRKVKPGEVAHRGRDLPDGDYDGKTWNRIKNAILKNEMLKIDVDLY